MSAFAPERLRAFAFAERRQAFVERDAILYALGVGLPLTDGDAVDLRFLVEDGLRVLPTFAVTLGSPGMWVKTPELGIDWVKLLHVGQAARFERPLPPHGEARCRARIKHLFDRGAGKGAVCVVERRIEDAADGSLYCVLDQTLLLRGDGGFGGEAPPKIAPPQTPARAPDIAESIDVSKRGALIYRLSGDVNPLHADYAVARRAGFERPILHGLASYGLAGALVVLRLCDGDPARLRSLDLRFAGVVTPGDRLDFAMWREGARVLFEARVGDRKALDQGIAEIA